MAAVTTDNAGLQGGGGGGSCLPGHPPHPPRTLDHVPEQTAVEERQLPQLTGLHEVNNQSPDTPNLEKTCLAQERQIYHHGTTLLHSLSFLTAKETIFLISFT